MTLWKRQYLISATLGLLLLDWGLEAGALAVRSLGAWPVRLAILGPATAVACGWILFVERRWQFEFAELKHYLAELLRLDAGELARRAERADLPRLPAHEPWRELARTFGDVLAKHAGSQAEWEQVKTTLEIRCRRVTDQCQRLAALVASVADPILAVDDYDELLLANPAAEELLGFRMPAAGKSLVRQLVRCEKLVELLLSSSHRKLPGSRTEELEIVDRSGKAVWYRLHVAALAGDRATAGESSAASGAVAVFHDISYQKALQKRNAEFVSAVSHEMKTPLSGIKAYVELLADGDAEDEETRQQFLAVIADQAGRLERLVENMLNLARIEAGVVQVNKQSRSINEILEEALRVVRPMAEAKSIQLAAEVSPLYLSVLADRDLLLQAAINLLSNAIKYTPEGGRVALRSHMAGDQVLFEVEDTGVGLAAEDCRRVFEKFYRVKGSQAMASGTGLGLPLAKHIVEDVHGGRLTLHSQLGVGSTFTVTLPQAAQMG
jgi:two-component system phosphate regulon sensor histidine kinase PhoR